MRRVLRPGGVFVITHSNDLFDVFTLNRYTVDFHARCFGSDPDDIASLLTHPDKPDRTTFNVRANPLVFRHELARYDLTEERQEFIHYHPQPPLLDERDPDDIDVFAYPDTLGWPAEERWRLMFQCSMFGSRSVRR